MKRTPFFFVFLLFQLILISCNTGTDSSAVPKQPAPQRTFTITDFTDTLSKQDTLSYNAIKNALQLYSALVPEDSTFADSAASALMQFITTVVAAKNDSLFKNPSVSTALPDPAMANLTERQKAALSALHANRLKAISDGEGGVYLVPLYETILPGIKTKTSAAVDTFLDLTANEDTLPTFLDAGLAIEIEELADRLITSEQLMAQTLPSYFKAKATALNRFYIRAFIAGSDNSPAVEYNTIQLNEKFKMGYDYLLAKHPSSKAAETIRAWLAVLASGDVKRIDSFRKDFL